VDVVVTGPDGAFRFDATGRHGFVVTPGDRRDAEPSGLFVSTVRGKDIDDGEVLLLDP
jgi:hypothetical protein